MCDAAADISPALRDSLERWALNNNCACVDLENDSEFKRIWVFCISFAAFVCLVITLVVLWSDRRKDDEVFEADEATETIEAAIQSETERKRPNKKSQAQLEHELEEATANEGPEPNIQRAHEHLRKTSPTENLRWRPIWGTGCSEFSIIGGIGTELYFRFLRRLGLTFLYMAGLTCVAVAFNGLSSFAPDNGQYLAKTTIGNMGSNVAGTAVPPNERYLVLISESGCQGTPVTTMTSIVAWLDFFAVILFVGSIAHFRFYTVPKIARLADEDDTTVKDFGVEIDKLPRTFPGMEERVGDGDLTRYEAELIDLLESRMLAMRQSNPSAALEKTGPPRVRELVLVRDFGGRLTAIKQKAVLMQDIEIHKHCGQEKQLAKKSARLERLGERLAKQLPSKEELPVIRAYAIVNTQQDASNLWTDYRFANYASARWFQTNVIARCGCLERCCPVRKRFFRGTAIRIREPPEPTNIIWENQDVPWKSRMIRKTIINLIFWVIVAVSFGLVYAANAGAKSNMKSNNQLLGDDTCDPVVKNIQPAAGEAEVYKCFVANATRWTMEYLQDGASEDEIGCWCGTIGYNKIINEPRLISGICSTWATNVATGVAIGVFATGIVIVINIVCKITLLFLAEEEKPLSETERNKSKMVKIWALQTLNTGFVIFCVNFSPPNGLPFGFIFLGEYGDSVRGWYSVVGAAVLMNMLANSVTPGSTAVVMMLVNKIRRKWATRKGKVKHHRILLRMFENPEFDIAAKFAQLLTTVFVTLTYSSGLPLLNVFAGFYMLYSYWCDKLHLLWGSKQPPAIDSRMARDAAELMLYAVALHLVFAIWMFGQPCVFPSSPLGGTLGSMSSSYLDQATSSSSYASTASQYGFEDRLTLKSTWMMFTLLLVLIALWLAWTALWIIGGTIGHFITCLRLCCCVKRAKVAPSAETESLPKSDQWDFAEGLIQRVCPPASYKMKYHPSFRHIKNSLDKSVQSLSSGNLKATAAAAKGTAVVKGPPVQEDVAKGFLKAAKAEYVDKEEAAVGRFFEAADVCAADQDVLGKFEDLIRGSESPEDAAKAIEEVAQKWDVAPPS